MSFMFSECHKLKYLNILNFTNNCETKKMFYGIKRNECEFKTNNKRLKQLFYSSLKYSYKK